MATNVEITSLSDEQYYYKLDNMVLSSSHVLQKLFKDRWKIVRKSDWVNGEENGEALYNLEGKRIKSVNSDPNVIKKIKEGCVENWDMTTLSLVIQNFGNAEDFKAENGAIRELKNIRNHLNHLSNNEVDISDYKSMMETFKKCLSILHVKEEDIEKMIERAGVTSSLIAQERVQELHKKAESFIKAKKFVEALDYYAEAIATPSLLPNDLASAYEKRAEFYLLTGSEEEIKEKSLKDVEKALELNDSSWKGHYLAGRCHRRCVSLDLAVKSLQHALSISPIQTVVKYELDECKALSGICDRFGFIEPPTATMTLEEMIQQHEESSGSSTTEAEYLKLQIEKAQKIGNGQDHVFEGHQYRNGWGVEKNLTEAFKYYMRAANMDNPEGIFYFAISFLRGMGVIKDVKRAMTQFQRASGIEPDIEYMLNMNFSAVQNVGEAFAQHCLGYALETGIGLAIDYEKAGKWYQRAAWNGVSESSCNLAILYSKGLCSANPVLMDIDLSYRWMHGISSNKRKLAKTCWQEAISQNNAYAYVGLVGHYFEDMEPELALETFKTAKENGCSRYENILETEFSQIFSKEKARREEDESAVTSFEKATGFLKADWTFKERLDRLIKWTLPCSLFYHDFFVDQKNAQVIEEKAKAGHGEASKVLRLFQNCKQMEKLLPSDGTSCSEENANKIVELAYDSISIPFYDILLPWKTVNKIRYVIDKKFETTRDDKSENAHRIRLLTAAYHLTMDRYRLMENMYPVQVLREGLNYYQEVPHFYYYYLTISYRACFLHDLALKYANEGLKIAPADPNLLFEKALNLENLDSQDDDVIAAWKEVLEYVPKGHHLLPEACFALSSFLLKKLCLHPGMIGMFLPRNEDRVKVAVEYYHLGIQAIKDALPCFNLAPSEARQIVEQSLTTLNRMDCTNYSDEGSDDYSDAEEFEENLRATSSKNDKECNILNPPETHAPACPSHNSKDFSTLQTKPYGAIPTTSTIAIEHLKKSTHKKQSLKHSVEIYLPVCPAIWICYVTPRLVQIVPRKATSLKPIVLKEMTAALPDYIYADRIIDLTVIDCPCIGQECAHLATKDENGDVIKLYLYNMEKGDSTKEFLGFGCNIAIMNPYVTLEQDGVRAIRNDEPRCIVYLGKTQEMCSLCREGITNPSCSRCDVANYCFENFRGGIGFSSNKN